MSMNHISACQSHDRIPLSFLTLMTRNGRTDEEEPTRASIHLNIPTRFYLVPGAAFLIGMTIGLMRGSRQASLRFLAENAHRPPRTVQGWYFYNKTKNYKMLFGGFKGAGIEASKLTMIGLGWVGIEEGLERVGWGNIREVGAALGTAGMFSAVYRLPWKTSRRMIMLGAMVGSSMRILRWGREEVVEGMRDKDDDDQGEGAVETKEDQAGLE